MPAITCVWCVHRMCNLRARSVHSVQSVCNGCAVCVQRACKVCAVGVQRVQRVGNVSNKCSGFAVHGVCATGVQWVCKRSAGCAVSVHTGCSGCAVSVQRGCSACKEHAVDMQ